MKFEGFEIKVALLGHVSVGKSTVLNALLGDKFSEVSMKRTTAGINFFRIHTNKPNEDTKGSDAHTNQDNWSPTVEEPQDAASTWQEIKTDNAVLRTHHQIQEKIFDIEIDESPCGKMAKNSHLVLVDVPGLNEAGSCDMFMEYVKEKWHTFDCVIVVMDAIQGVNTDEQVNLLKFVQKQCASIRGVPIIVLGNKADDPDDEEVMGLVEEVRHKIEDLFRVECRLTALERVLELHKKGSHCVNRDLSPVFIPVSAGNAFLYRMAHGRKFEDFKKLDKQVIDKIGRNEVCAARWKKYSVKKKAEVAYSAVSSTSEYEVRLENTNFDKFLCVLRFFVGGEMTQKAIFKNQVEVGLKRLSWERPLVPQLDSLLTSSRAIGSSTDFLSPRFFELYDEKQKDALSRFSEKMELGGIVDAMDQLVDFLENFIMKLHSKSADGTVGEGWKRDEEEAINLMKKLVIAQCSTICDKFSDPPHILDGLGDHWVWDKNGGVWRNNRTKGVQNTAYSIFSKFKHPSVGKRKKFSSSSQKTSVDRSPWDELSPYDRYTIAGSILLLAHSPSFVEHFGREKLNMELLQRELNLWFACIRCPYQGQVHSIYCSSGSHPIDTTRTSDGIWGMGTYDVNGVFVPRSDKDGMVKTRIRVPESPSDPDHWACLVWRFCKFMDGRHA